MESSLPRILVAEPQEMICGLLVDRLRSKGFDVVATAVDGRSAISRALEHQPDVVVLDIDIRDPDGVSVIREMLKADRRRRIVVLTASDDVLSARYAIHEGAMAFVSKHHEFGVLETALESVLRGDTAMTTSVTGPHGRRRSDRVEASTYLSAREVEVLGLVASGLSNNEIAERLFISARTVKNHLSSVYDKLGVNEKSQALVRAVRLGIVGID